MSEVILSEYKMMKCASICLRGQGFAVSAHDLAAGLIAISKQVAVRLFVRKKQKQQKYRERTRTI